jgi:hypothetical protein
MRLRPVVLALAVTVSLAAMAATQARARWDPVPAADLAAKPPASDPEADAEVLLWNAYIDDAFDELTVHHEQRHFRRVKIYTADGAEKYGLARFQYPANGVVSEVSGRTIHPDGTILEMKKDQSFDDVVVKEHGRGDHVRSFALPQVVPGSVIEYRYTVTIDDAWADGIDFDLQQAIPVRTVVYHISPLAVSGLHMVCRAFNVKVKQSSMPLNGYWEFRADSLTAYRPEPMMAPERQVRAWMLLDYRYNTQLDGVQEPQKFWREYGRDETADFERWTRPGDATRELAARVAGAEASDSARVDALFEYCRTHLRLLQSDDADTLKRAGFKSCKNADEVLHQGGAVTYEGNRCFAALARAAGFETRLVRLTPKTWLPFRPEYTEGLFLRDSVIGVRVGNRWIAYDLAARHLPAGMVEWEEENQLALLCSKDSSEFALTPISPPEASVRSRVADLVLGEDGTLRGHVRVEVSGHWNERVRSDADGDDERSLLRSLKADVPLAVDPAAWDSAHVIEPGPAWQGLVVDVPVHESLSSAAPADRWWLEPFGLIAEKASLLPAGERKHPVQFPFAWSERDTVRIALPQGWHPEPMQQPQPILAPDVALHRIAVRIEPSTGRLVCARTLDVGIGNVLDFRPDDAATLKRFFDLARDSDHLTVPLAKGFQQ